MTWHSLMQLINNFEKKIVKSPSGKFSSAFRTSRDSGVLSLCMQACTKAVHHQDAAICVHIWEFSRD